LLTVGMRTSACSFATARSSRPVASSAATAANVHPVDRSGSSVMLARRQSWLWQAVPVRSSERRCDPRVDDRECASGAD
jgi:hypothetical protein